MLSDGFYEINTAKRSGCGERKAFMHNGFNHWVMENCSVYSTLSKWGTEAGECYVSKRSST